MRNEPSLKKTQRSYTWGAAHGSSGCEPTGRSGIRGPDAESAVVGHEDNVPGRGRGFGHLGIATVMEPEGHQG